MRGVSTNVIKSRDQKSGKVGKTLKLQTPQLNQFIPYLFPLLHAAPLIMNISLMACASIPAARPGTDSSLERALRWAASRRRPDEDALVVLAGSLYLVADFYRLLQRLGQADEIWGAN